MEQNQTAGLPKPGFTRDAFLGGRLQMLQPEKGYRAGIDAVFLAASIPARPGDSVFEAGIGAGVAGLCLLARVPNISLTGIEIAQRYALVCSENARANGFAPQVKVIHADVKDALKRDLAEMPAHGSFAHAFANPPFHEEGTVTQSPSLLKSQAHAFGPDDLQLWVKVMAALVANRGTVSIIHRADALDNLLAAMTGRLGAITIAPLFPRPGEAASRVLVRGVKGSKAPLRLLPGLVLHGDGHGFTPAAEAVLRQGAAWNLD